MTVTTSWWWIRHAPVTEDGGCIYGQSDIDANFSDKPSYAGLASALPKDAVWVTSQLSRARGTAAAIAEAGLEYDEPVIEPGFAEQHFGEWQGQPRAEVHSRNPDWRRFWLAPAHATPPGGESFVAVMERVAAGIARHTESHAGRHIVSVSHGGPIRAAIAVAIGLAPEGALGFAIDNLSITRLDHIAGAGPDGGETAWRVVTINRPPVACG